MPPRYEIRIALPARDLAGAVGQHASLMHTLMARAAREGESWLTQAAMTTRLHDRETGHLVETDEIADAVINQERGVRSRPSANRTDVFAKPPRRPRAKKAPPEVKP